MWFMKKLLTFILMACTITACKGDETGEAIKVIAHRGGAALGPENTLSCIKEGIKAGAYAVEVDVHLTSDGYIVVCHDETLDRTTNGKGRIEEMTLEQVRSVTIPNGDSVEKIPTLEEVLDLVNGQCVLLLEIKKSREGQYPQIEDKVIDMLERTGMKDQVIIQSFNDGVLERIHEIDPEMPLEKLIICRLPFGFAYDIKVRRFSFDDYPYVQSFNPNNTLTTKRFVRQVHKRGKMVRVWTVDKPRKVLKGVDAVITNHPDRY